MIELSTSIDEFEKLKKAKDRKNELNRTPKQRKKTRERIKRYRQNPVNKWKEKARLAVYAALKKGILERPEICELCGQNPGRGSDGRSLIRGDHCFGYDKENWLKVRWICVECDGKAQRKF